MSADTRTPSKNPRSNLDNSDLTAREQPPQEQPPTPAQPSVPAISATAMGNQGGLYHNSVRRVVAILLSIALSAVTAWGTLFSDPPMSQALCFCAAALGAVILFLLGNFPRIVLQSPESHADTIRQQENITFICAITIILAAISSLIAATSLGRSKEFPEILPLITLGLGTVTAALPILRSDSAGQTASILPRRLRPENIFRSLGLYNGPLTLKRNLAIDTSPRRPSTVSREVISAEYAEGHSQANSQIENSPLPTRERTDAPHGSLSYTSSIQPLVTRGMLPDGGSKSEDAPRDELPLSWTSSRFRRALARSRPELVTLQETKTRLRDLVERLSSRASFNLAFGVVFALSGVVLLLFSLIQIQESPSAFDHSAIEFLALRMSATILLAALTFFFLRLYSATWTTITYFHNEMTNVDTKIAALSMLVARDVESEMARVLITSERNFRIGKDETTVEIEKAKIDAGPVLPVIDALKGLGLGVSRKSGLKKARSPRIP